LRVDPREQFNPVGTQDRNHASAGKYLTFPCTCRMMLACGLLLVEDDARISRFVAKGLREQAYAVDVANTGDDAL